MSKMMTVKEVCELTGLNRKLLHDYDQNGIVKPSAYKNRGYTDKNCHEYDGYKLYDEKSVIKLHQAAIFRKLHVKRADIKKWLTASDYDGNQLLQEQILMLKKEKEEIEKLIIVAEQLRLFGMNGRNILDYIASMDMETLANSVEQWQNSEYYNYLSRILDRYDVNDIRIMNELLTFNENECESEKAMNTAKKLFEVNIKGYGVAGFLLVLIIALSGQGNGQLIVDLDYDFGVKVTEISSQIVINYMMQDMEVLSDEFVEIIIKYYEILGVDFADRRVLEMVKEMETLFERHFGIKEKEEYNMLFHFVQLEPYKKGDDDITYVLNAIKHHCKMY